MSEDRKIRDFRDPIGHITTYVYDSAGSLREIHTPTGRSAYEGPTQSPAPADAGQAKPAPPAGPPVTPLLTHAFEFRLSGSEAHEQCFALSGPYRSNDVLLVTQRVSAYLTRMGAPADATSAIAGLEVHAELQDRGIVCTARLTDFGPGDLVVIRVDVALF